ncbi:hypothetical protein N9A70_05640, partial [Akkermansiaceae bacterium]|nr:hypothetical protein [Akkermansiaceae bacterium]
DEIWPAEGGLHDEDVRPGKPGRLRGPGRAGFKIAGVEKRLVGPLDSDHGRAGNMASGVEGDAVVVDDALVAPIKRFDGRGFNTVAFDKNVAGAGGAKYTLVAGEVICVSVRDEGEGLRAMRVEPHSEIRKVERFGVEVQRHALQ